MYSPFNFDTVTMVRVLLRVAHRREAALLRLGVIWLAIAHAVAAALHRLVRGDGAHFDLRSCRFDGQY